MVGRVWFVVALAAIVLGGVGIPAALAQGGTDDLAQLEAGQAVFEANCARCHGADGMGSQTGRSLIGIAMSQPDRSVHVASVTTGKGNMPAFGERLSAEEIDAAVSYVRLTFVDPAAQSDPAELAVTGTASTPIAALGATLLVSGLLLVTIVGRRRPAGTA